jgi:hypothetical protein
LLDLRLPTIAARVAARAACVCAPRSVAVFDLCIAVASAGLDTVRIVLDKVVNIVVEIRVSLPVLTPVAILLYAPSRDVESASRRMVFSSLSSGQWLSAGPPCGNFASRSSSAAWYASM